MAKDKDNGGLVSPRDAEETLEAIQRGSVDAVVVQGADGPRVIMLQGAEEPYRVLVERMSDGALTIGPDQTVVYANTRLGEMVGALPKDLIGQPFQSLFKGPPPIVQENNVSEAHLGRAHGGALPVSVWIQPLAIGEDSATLVTLTDLSIHHRAAETAAAERFARSILEQATDAILVLAIDGRVTHASLLAYELAKDQPVGHTFSEMFPLVATNLDQAGILARFSSDSLDAMLVTKPYHGVEVKLQDPRFARRTFLLSTGPLLNDDQQSVGAIVTLTEITERKRAEEQQTTLVAELNHRVKNILAIVQSVAAQTVRAAPSLETFTDVFSGRLKAISIAHDILTQTRWIGIGLGELLRAVLEPHQGADSQSISAEGPPTMLPARTVVPLSMVLHELATNAAKYGALSVPAGCVDIAWRSLNSSEDRIEIVWQERQGPQVERQPKGFGTRLIERVMTYDLEGEIRIDYEPAGVRCTIGFPLHPI